MVTMTDPVPPPQEVTFPLTKGCDLAFTVRRVDTNGAPVNFAAGAGVSMWIDIDPAAPTEVTATVSGSDAAVVVPKAVADLARTRTRYRLILDGNIDSPLLVGKLVRHDG